MRRWGRFVYRHRKAVLVASLACFVRSIIGLATGGQPINRIELRCRVRARGKPRRYAAPVNDPGHRSR